MDAQLLNVILGRFNFCHVEFGGQEETSTRHEAELSITKVELVQALESVQHRNRNMRNCLLQVHALAGFQDPLHRLSAMRVQVGLRVQLLHTLVVNDPQLRRDALLPDREG